MAAPTDEQLRQDIELSKAAGFNGARLHQKVFEERYHYWADKLGFITWGESANFGMDLTSFPTIHRFLNEWKEVVIRDRNHPSIVTWTLMTTPFSAPKSTNIRNYKNAIAQLSAEGYELTKLLDPTRPVIDIAGEGHVHTDIWATRNYATDNTQFAKGLKLPENNPAFHDQPFIVGEFGGTAWGKSPRPSGQWEGHGKKANNEDSFYQQLTEWIDAIQASGYVAGFCYTQLTDIEQEINGIYQYDRTPKFDMETIKAIIEKIPSRPVQSGQ